MKNITLNETESINLETELSKRESTKLESAMCYLFAGGVIITFVLAIAGVVSLYLSQGHINLLNDRSAFIHQQSFFVLLSSLIQGINVPKGTLLFVTLGMVSLVLTPLFAVAMAGVYFASKKNMKYVGITLLVLAILLTSLALH